jgi:hypothetical protein
LRGVGLDRREGVVVHRDDGRGADELAGADRVAAVHRVVAADRHQEDVDVAAFGDQLHVAEQAGVAGVVDGRLADLDHQPGGRPDRDPVRGRVGVPGGDEGDVAPVVLDGASQVRVLDRLDPLFAKPVRELDQGDRLGAGPFEHRDRVGDVVGVAVADRDVGRLDLLGGGDRDRVVRLQERVGEDGRPSVGQLEAGLTVELDLHISALSIYLGVFDA